MPPVSQMRWRNSSPTAERDRTQGRVRRRVQARAAVLLGLTMQWQGSAPMLRVASRIGHAERLGDYFTCLL